MVAFVNVPFFVVVVVAAAATTVVSVDVTVTSL
jgi:hypothetical protein